MNQNIIKHIVRQQKQLWKKNLDKYGLQPEAVGSESVAHKELRYQQISQVFNEDANFSLLDVGAGVGDYFGYLSRHFSEKKIRYRGAEITPEFCGIAREKYPDIAIDTVNILEDEIDHHDYVVLSGIFHQKGNATRDEWKKYMEKMIIRAFQICSKGIAFNVLSHHAEFQREGNFHVNLNNLQDFIVDHLSRFYTLNHAYPLFEATITIYKTSTVLSRYKQKEFKKYIK